MHEAPVVLNIFAIFFNIATETLVKMYIYEPGMAGNFIMPVDLVHANRHAFDEGSNKGLL